MTPSAVRADEIEALTNFASAQTVIGQPDFTHNGCNEPTGLVAVNNLCSPEGAVARRGRRLYVPDSNDSRVLGFKKVPKKNGASAKFVLGEPNFTTTNFSSGNPAFNFPTDVAISRGKLFVVDFGNSRVLIWNTLPAVTDTPADVVVGQPDFNADSSTTTRSGLNLPEYLAVAKGKLFVADRNNNRILIWNQIPTSNGAPADLVLGQTDFVSSRADTTPATLNEPLGLWSDGTRLAVADAGNNRVLIWNQIPTTNGAAADVVVGQADFTSRDSPDPPTAQSLAAPFHLSSDGKRLFVADHDNNRVLIYEPFPTTNFPTASVVLGQPDFTSNMGNAPNGLPSARGLGGPSGALFSKGKLFVTDEGNSRILVFRAK